MIELLKSQMTKQQIGAAWKCANKDMKGIVYHKVGEGKTRIAIAWMFMISNKPRPLIVCSPGAIRQWLDEIDLLRLDGIIDPEFISSGMLSRMTSKTHYYVVDLKKVNCIVVDELWMFKNYKSNRNVEVKQLTSKLPSIGLSGSMMTAGNLEDLYGQAKAMNLDKKLANSMSSFREQFMITMNNWAGFTQHFARKGAVEAIQRRLIDNVDVYFPKDKREIRDIPVHVEATKEQLELRRQLVRTYSYEDSKKGFNLDIKNAASLLVKLQQVSDGFLKDREGNYIYVRSSKQARLKELCSELLDAGERLLIWVGFRKTASLLANLLPVKTTILSGDGKFDSFGWKDNKVKITIATVGSGSSLNDFANIGYSIFYSTTFSHLNVQQARGRTNRKSSLHNCCYYYFLSTNKFPDKEIYEAIEDNKSKEEIVIRTANRILTEWREQHEL
jgi:hypothetical protein